MNTLYPLMSKDENQQPTIRLYMPQTGVEWRCINELVYMEAQLNYTWLYWTDRPQLLVPYTIKRIVEKLPATCFVRIHRKFVINYTFVDGWDLRYKDCSVFLSTGISLPISRRCRDFFMEKQKTELATLRDGSSVHTSVSLPVASSPNP